MPRIFINLEAGCLQINLMSTSTQINQLKYTILYYTILYYTILYYTMIRDMTPFNSIETVYKYFVLENHTRLSVQSEMFDV